MKDGVKDVIKIYLSVHPFSLGAALNKDRSRWNVYLTYDVVTCYMKLFQNDFSLRRRPLTEVVIFRRAETCLKLF